MLNASGVTTTNLWYIILLQNVSGIPIPRAKVAALARTWQVFCLLTTISLSKGPGGKGKGSVRGYGRGLAASFWDDYDFDADFEAQIGDDSYGFVAQSSDKLN